MSHRRGIGLLLGVLVVAAVFLWNAREPRMARPVDLVTLRTPLHAAGPGVEVVPYQFAVESPTPACSSAPAGGLCLIIGTGNATLAPKTFT